MPQVTPEDEGEHAAVQPGSGTHFSVMKQEGKNLCQIERSIEGAHANAIEGTAEYMEQRRAATSG